jgi:hypothetical protein
MRRSAPVQGRWWRVSRCGRRRGRRGGLRPEFQGRWSGGLRSIRRSARRGRADEADDRCPDRDDADDVGAPADLFVQPFLGVVGQIWRQGLAREALILRPSGNAPTVLTDLAFPSAFAGGAAVRRPLLRGAVRSAAVRGGEATNTSLRRSWSVAMTLSHAHDDARTGPLPRANPVNRGCQRREPLPCPAVFEPSAWVSTATLHPVIGRRVQLIQSNACATPQVSVGSVIVTPPRQR